MRTDALIFEATPKFDPETDIRGAPALKRLVQTLRRTDVYRTLISFSEDRWSVFKNFTKLGADFYRKNNGLPPLYGGLSYLRDKCDRVLIAPANYPLFLAKTITRLLETDADIAAASFNGKRGFPLLISVRYIDEILSAKNLDAFIKAHASEISLIDTADPGATFNAAHGSVEDTFGDNPEFDRLWLLPRYMLARGDSFFGFGIAQIFRLVEETGMMDDVYLMTGMSTSHAWKILNRMKERIGLEPFDTLCGVYTRLTPESRRFLIAYEQCERMARRAAESEFYEFFEEFR